MRTYDNDTARVFYLNNSGSRCVKIDANGNRERLRVTFDGITMKMVAVKYWEQCGNFSFPVVRHGKKLVAVYPDSEVEVSCWMPIQIRHPDISMP